METLRELAQAALVGDDRASAAFFQAVNPIIKQAIRSTSTPKHEIDDVHQETNAALWRNLTTVAMLEHDNVVRAFVKRVAVNRALTEGRRAKRRAPVADGDGWYPDPHSHDGQTRWWDAGRWSPWTRHPDGTLHHDRLSEIGRRKPRMTRVPWDDVSLGDSVVAVRDDIEALIGRLALGHLADGRRLGGTTAMLHPGSIPCHACPKGICESTKLTRPAVTYAIAGLLEGDRRVDGRRRKKDPDLGQLLRAGLEQSGVTQNKKRNILLACCLAVLEHELGWAIAGPEVLKALDSSIKGSKNNQAWDRVAQLAVWRAQIQERTSDKPR